MGKLHSLTFRAKTVEGFTHGGSIFPWKPRRLDSIIHRNIYCYTSARAIVGRVDMLRVTLQPRR